MSGGGSGWLKGCGIGCAVVLLLLILIGVGGGLFVKRTVDSVRATGDAIDALEEEFGNAGDFTPAADGRLAAERIEVFLAVRDDTERRRRSTAKIFSTLDSEGRGGVLAKIRAGMKLLPALKSYVDDRTEAMRRHGMGPGEYAYFYGLIYYGWLEFSPGDGPDFRISGDDDDHDFSAEDVREERLIERLDYMNWGGRHWLANQLEAIDAAGGGDGPWRERVAAELEALEDDRTRMAWRDGLPERIADSLAPYRARLAASYDPMTNAVEFMVEHRH